MTAPRPLTEGSIPRHLVRLALPVIAGMTLQSIYALIDLGWVGMLGEDAVAGLSISFQAFFVILAVSQVFATTALADISQAWGAGRFGDAHDALSGYLIGGVAVGTVSAIAAYVGAELYVSLLTADAQVLELGTAYFRVNAATFLTQLLILVLGVAFRGSGDFQTPVRVMAMSVALNLLVDPVFMFGATGWPNAHHPVAAVQIPLLQAIGLGSWSGMGIAGAALATVLSQAVAMLAYAALLTTRRPGAIRLGTPRLTRRFAARLLFRGVPAGIQFILMSAILGILLYAVKYEGPEWTAATGGGFRFIQQVILPIVAIASAAAAVAGQTAGAGQMDRVAATWRSAILGTMAYATVGTVFFWTSGRVVGHLFAEGSGLDAAEVYFRWYAPALFGFALSIVATFMLQALKRPTAPMWAAAGRVAVMAGLILGLGLYLGLPPSYAYAVAAVTGIGEGIADAWLLRRFLNESGVEPAATG